MKRGLILLAVAAILISAIISALALRKRRLDAASRNREIGYTAVLNSYSKALHPGMTRNEVEAYLQAANTRFGAADTGKLLDLVEIGKGETSAWICSEEYAYVALEFSPMGGTRTPSAYHLPGQFIRGEGTDVLQNIEIYRVTDCL
jgi:hypothetical protein